MKTATNIENAMGVTLPKVYITRISLTDGGDIRRATQDPHIQHPDETSVATLNEINDTINNKSLHVKINMVLKETSSTSAPLTFLMNNDVLKYIRVRIVQCIDPSTSSLIAANPSGWLKSGGVLDKRSSATRGVQPKIISLNQFTMTKFGTVTGTTEGGESQTNIEQVIADLPFAKEQDANGNMVYNVPLESSFVISPQEGGSQVNYLTYYVCAYFDFQDFMIETSEFGEVRLPKEITDGLLGDISSEMVISNGVVSKAAYAFMAVNNNYWLGPVHQSISGQWVQGATPPVGRNVMSAADMRALYLRRIEVPNWYPFESSSQSTLRRL